MTNESKPRDGLPSWKTLALSAIALLIIGGFFYYLLMAGVILYAFSGWKILFYEKLGLSDSLSTLLGNVLAFGSAFAVIPLFWLTYRTFNLRKFEIRKFVLAFAGFLFVFALGPFLQWSFAQQVCFNQATGEPLKWYDVGRDGEIVLFDHAGYDPTTGLARTPATADICQIYAQQLKGVRAHLITQDPLTIEFFRADNGYPLVWYSRTPDGSIRLFDGPGFDPISRDRLRPVTKDIINKLTSDVKASERNAADKATREAEEQRQHELQRAEEVAQQAKKDAEEARQRELQAEEAAKQAKLQGGIINGPPSNSAQRGPAMRREDCIEFDPASVRATNVGGRWKVTQGTMSMLDYGSNPSAANRATDVIHHYNFNQQCFVGRPHPPMMYWKIGNSVPSEELPGNDCVGFDPMSTSVVYVHGAWKVVDGSHWMLDYGPDKFAADQALAVIKSYRLSRQCFIVRPHASMRYWLAQ